MNSKNTAQDHTAAASPLLRWAKALVALGTAGVALATAGPASATPIDGIAEKRSCELKTQLGSQYYEHGSTVTVEGNTKTFRCNDGTWEAVKKAEADTSGTFGSTSGTHEDAPATTTTYRSPSGTELSYAP